MIYQKVKHNTKSASEIIKSEHQFSYAELGTGFHPQNKFSALQQTLQDYQQTVINILPRSAMERFLYIDLKRE